MPIDASIPLSFQQINPMQSLASVAGVANQMQGLRNAQVENQLLQQSQQQSAIDLQETQASRQVLSNIKQYQNSDGSIDFNKLMPDIMAVAPKNGSAILANVYGAQNAATSAKKAIIDTDEDARQNVGNIMYGLQGKDPMTVHNTIEMLKDKYPTLGTALNFAGQYLLAPNVQDQEAFDNGLRTFGRMMLSPQTQQQMESGALSAVPTENGTQLVQLNTGASTPQGAPVGQPYTPPNQIMPSPTGGLVRVNPATGVATNLHGSGGGEAPLTNYPPGENAATYQALEDQRNAALLAANQAPVMHNITAEIKNALDSGVPAGQLGGTIAKFRSVLGIASPASEQGASNYDILGKMLERQALVAAQGMGPQTNAGLEAQIKANGSPHYNPTALREIANLNDALVTGSQKYQQGLEQAINQSGGNIFSKRQYDQQWAQNADPYALRLLNAAKNGDQQEIHEIFTRIGGPNSAQGKALQQKLLNLKKLSETGSLQ